MVVGAGSSIDGGIHAFGRAGCGARGAERCGCATAAENETLNNRVLHPQEQPLTKPIAAIANARGITNLDGSPVTATDVANQLAQMGYHQITPEAGTAATVEGSVPPNDGTTWMPAGVDSTTGQRIWAQVPGTVNPALQSLIIQATNGGDVPAFANSYTASPAGAQPNIGPQGPVIGSSAGSICPNGNCGFFNASMQPLTTQQLADASGSASTYLSRASAVATTVAETNAENPTVAVPAVTTAIMTQVGSWAFGGIQQALSPNLGQYTTENLIDFGTKLVTDTNPAFAPVFGEIGELLKGGGAASATKNRINNFWNSMFGGAKGK